jgi:hypothetical protein
VNERHERAIAPPKIPLRVDERMLLMGMLADPELRAEIVGRLKGMEAVEGLELRRIFRAVFALDESGGRVAFDEVNARLEEADQNLLAHALLNEDCEISRDEVLAALASMQKSDEQYQRVRLKAKITESERAGRFEEAMRLTMELQGLEQAARPMRR